MGTRRGRLRVVYQIDDAYPADCDPSPFANRSIRKAHVRIGNTGSKPDKVTVTFHRCSTFRRARPGRAARPIFFDGIANGASCLWPQQVHVSRGDSSM